MDREAKKLMKKIAGKKDVLFIVFLLIAYAVSRFVYFKYEVPFPGSNNEGLICTAAVAAVYLVMLFCGSNVISGSVGAAVGVGMCFYSPAFFLVFFPPLLCAVMSRCAPQNKKADAVLYKICFALFMILGISGVIFTITELALGKKTPTDGRDIQDFWFLGLYAVDEIIYALLFNGSFHVGTAKELHGKKKKKGFAVSTAAAEKLHSVYFFSMIMIILSAVYLGMMRTGDFIKAGAGVWLMNGAYLVISGEPWLNKLVEKIS